MLRLIATQEAGARRKGSQPDGLQKQQIIGERGAKGLPEFRLQGGLVGRKAC